jgi:HSP20 family protein
MSNLLPDAWREAMERVHDNVGNFLNRLVPWKKQEQYPERITADTLPSKTQSNAPLLDMYESTDDVILRIEVPGFINREDCSVELAGRRLIITGEKKVARDRKGGDRCHISECRYGRFCRIIQLPYDVDEKLISANLKHGVLTIRLPKPEMERHARYHVPVS